MGVLEEAKYMIGAIERTFEITEDDIDPPHPFSFTSLSRAGTLNDGMGITHANQCAKRGRLNTILPEFLGYGTTHPTNF